MKGHHERKTFTYLRAAHHNLSSGGPSSIINDHPFCVADNCAGRWSPNHQVSYLQDDSEVLSVNT